MRLRLEKSADDRILLTVADQGSGGAEVKPKGGFGTRLTQAMVSSLGGTLRVDSGGTGTTVYLDLPLGEF